RTVRDLLDEQTDGVVIVGHLQTRRVDAVQGRPKASEVVMRESDERKVRQVPIRDELVELSLPLLEQKEIGIILIEAAEVEIRVVHQRFLRRDSLLNFLSERSSGNRNVPSIRFRIVVPRQIAKHTVIAKRQTRSQHFIPKIAGSGLA